MLTVIVVTVIVFGILYIGYTRGAVHTENRIYENKETKEEIDWRKTQVHEILKELNDWKRKYNDLLLKYNKVKKETIADKNEENIKSLFNEGLSDKDIAETLGCGKSTIQRAIKKFGLR